MFVVIPEPRIKAWENRLLSVSVKEPVLPYSALREKRKAVIVFAGHKNDLASLASLSITAVKINL